MRKAEFKKQVEKTTDKHGDLILSVYKALQYRWKETADPQTEDEAYFFTQEEAEEYLETLSLTVGFQDIVDKIDFEYKDFNNTFDFGSEGEIKDFLPSYIGNIETVFWGVGNEGNDITGSIIVRWSYEKYVGYCRNLKDIGIAGEYPFHEFTTEADLITGNEESTFRDNYSVLLTLEEVSQADDLFTAIEEELMRGHWKWNYFRNNPNTEHIQETIRKICGIPGYPFSEGDDYWVVENGEVVWSCWDEQSEELFRENPDQEYFETEEEAKNSLL